MNEPISQAMILVLSGSAIWLVTAKEPRHRRIGCWLGLAGQPFWIYTSWQNAQWGILAISAWFTLSYAKGLRNFTTP